MFVRKAGFMILLPISHLPLHSSAGALKIKKPTNIVTMKIRLAVTGGGKLGIELLKMSHYLSVPISRTLHYWPISQLLRKIHPKCVVIVRTWQHSRWTVHSPQDLSKTISDNCLTSQLLETAITFGTKKRLTKKSWKNDRGTKMFVGGGFEKLWNISRQTRKPHAFAELCACSGNTWGEASLASLADFQALHKQDEQTCELPGWVLKLCSKYTRKPLAKTGGLNVSKHLRKP